ncbi:MAG: hypothetical protein U0230_26030, partial [Polyangiales bacterium]
ADMLLGVVADFPFASDDDRATFLGALLTPIGRFAFGGPAPIFLIEANVRGAGKSLLADVIGIVATGRSAARTAYVHDDAEMRKRITSTALEAAPIVLLDNIHSVFGLPSLDAAVTSTTWKDRVLGKSENTDPIPMLTLWLATGNNVQIMADTARRTARIRLESPDEHPEDRTGFRHPDLLAYVRRERPRLVQAALTILRAFFVAKEPTCGLQPWGSFEGWSAVIRNAVYWTTGADPKANQIALRAESDTEALALAALIDGMEHLDPYKVGMTAREILERLAADSGALEGMREAVETLAPSGKGGALPTPRGLAKALQRFKGRIVGDRCLQSHPYQGTHRWKVVRGDPVGRTKLGGGGGGGGFVPPVTGPNTRDSQWERSPQQATDPTKPTGGVHLTQSAHEPGLPSLDDDPPSTVTLPREGDRAAALALLNSGTQALDANPASGREDPAAGIPDDLRQPLAFAMERLAPEKHEACAYVARTFPDRARRAGCDIRQWQAICAAEMARRSRQ